MGAGDGPDARACASCGYDSRGLPVEGACPECGLAVRESVIIGTAPAPESTEGKGYAEAAHACGVLSLFTSCINGIGLGVFALRAHGRQAAGTRVRGRALATIRMSVVGLIASVVVLLVV